MTSKEYDKQLKAIEHAIKEWKDIYDSGTGVILIEYCREYNFFKITILKDKEALCTKDVEEIHEAEILKQLEDGAKFEE